jgi:inosine/xanthosine triphosphatase
MPTIVIASQNPVKGAAALSGFQKMFPDTDWTLESITVLSGVSDQPMSDHETRQGAENRAKAARQNFQSAEYWVGIEGGIEMQSDMAAFAWVVVVSRTQTGMARTGTFFLPDAVAALVREGKELGEADDIVFNKQNSKQNNGAVGLLTGNIIDRTRFYEEAVVLALIPFKNKELYHP